MKNQIKEIPNDVQDKNSDAWKKLCAYIDEIAQSGAEEFAPREALGPELYAQIFTLPASIEKLKKVKKVWLYGSKLKRIPPEIGGMEALENFDPYTSYDLNWLPYEITKCKKLNDSRISTRALYGNFKHRTPFPNLIHNPVRYEGSHVNCSICEKQITYDTVEQYWISLGVGTDVMPLLANICSEKCKNELPTPPANYVAYPHKGGANQEQPPDSEQIFKEAWEKIERGEKVPGFYSIEEFKDLQKNQDSGEIKPLKLIRKNWDK